MAVTLKDGLRALAESARLAPAIRIEIDDEYFRHIATIEAMPSNQTGADKSSVWSVGEAFKEHYRQVKPV